MKKNILFTALFAAILVGCGESSNSQQTPAPVKTSNADNTKLPLIVTSFYPLTFITEQIVGEKAEVVNIAGSVDVHAYDPSPQDLVKLNNASLVVFQGAELEPWADSVIPELNSKGVATLEVTHDLELAKMEEHEDEHDSHSDEHHGSHSDEHHEEHESHTAHTEEKHQEADHHDEHGDEHHHHGEFDPHTWLDPILAQQMVDKILTAVIATDAANEVSYQANAQVLKKRFAQLDQAFQTGLSQCANDKFIVSHDAYGYLARRYQFEFYSITGISPQDEPSAKILAELKNKAQDGISHILIEENNIRHFADTLANETGLQILSANPLGRGTLDPQKDFFDVMEDNLNSFKTALNCQ